MNSAMPLPRFLFLVWAMVLLEACSPTPVPFTMEQPQMSNVVGRYTFTWNSVLNLASTGTFTATNVPPAVIPIGADTFKCLVTGSGTWRLDKVVLSRPNENSPRWRVVLQSQNTAFSSPALIGNPPYALLFTSDESPHNQTLMTFQKEK